MEGLDVGTRCSRSGSSLRAKDCGGPNCIRDLGFSRLLSTEEEGFSDKAWSDKGWGGGGGTRAKAD